MDAGESVGKKPAAVEVKMELPTSTVGDKLGAGMLHDAAAKIPASLQSAVLVSTRYHHLSAAAEVVGSFAIVHFVAAALFVAEIDAAAAVVVVYADIVAAFGDIEVASIADVEACWNLAAACPSLPEMTKDLCLLVEDHQQLAAMSSLCYFVLDRDWK